MQAALVGICALLSLATTTPSTVLRSLLVLLVLALGSGLAYLRPSLAPLWPYAGAVVAAVAVPWTGGATSPLFPYLLAPGLTLGLTRGWRQVLELAALSAGALAAGATPDGALTDRDFAIAAVQWLVLSVALGAVASWARRLALPEEASGDYREVRELLEQLRGLTRHLPGGLDAPSAAAAVLERCDRLVSPSRSAVLVRPTSGSFVPLAVSGARRVPWRAPLDQDGPLRRAWESRRTVVDKRRPDKVGRRSGSALVAIPLLSSGDPFGLFILDTQDVDSLDAAVVARLESIVKEATAQLEAAMLFEEVRLAASAEERDRLAREMHDGIAQELAFFGYRLDDLRFRAAAVDAELATAVSEVRTDLTTLISDIRLSITDLKTTVRPDRGLGTALSSYLQAVCSGKKVVLNLSLQETAFRLPADQEVALFKAAQAFAQEARRTPEVTELTVTLTVDPPSAHLRMFCDGPFVTVELGDVGPILGAMGADVALSRGKAGGPFLDIELRGGEDVDQRAPGRRPRPDPARAAPGL